MEKDEEWLDRAVTMDKVYKFFRSTKDLAIANVSFSSYYGQVTVLLGHDGSGKSTIMKLISGDYEATRGLIGVLSLVKKRNNRHRGKDIGYCSEEITLFDHLTVFEHLWFFYCLKTGAEDWKGDAVSTANDVGLSDFLNKKPAQLNETKKRLLSLAIAFVGGSPVVLMDDPFKGLDAETKDIFRNILDVKKDERCILVATSSTETAEMIGDRIVMLSNGRVLAAGSIPFLKTEFGSSYILNVLLSSEASNLPKTIPNIERTVQKFVPSAELRLTCGKSVQFGFNSNDHNEHIALLRGLERIAYKLGISEYYITLCTLMDVYRRVEICNFKDDSDYEEDEEEPEARRGVCSLDQQFGMLMKKRLYLLPNFHCCFVAVRTFTGSAEERARRLLNARLREQVIMV
ncbi:ABC transporter, ATP-binding protein [Cooperia oncophora]